MGRGLQGFRELAKLAVGAVLENAFKQRAGDAPKPRWEWSRGQDPRFPCRPKPLVILERLLGGSSARRGAVEGTNARLHVQQAATEAVPLSLNVCKPPIRRLIDRRACGLGSEGAVRPSSQSRAWGCHQLLALPIDDYIQVEDLQPTQGLPQRLPPPRLPGQRIPPATQPPLMALGSHSACSGRPACLRSQVRVSAVAHLVPGTWGGRLLP